MSAWTYYSPLWLGMIVAGVVGYGNLEQLSSMEPGLRWTVLVLGCVGVGVQCQLAMIGCQGVFAQVLPIPRGRSIRGRGAVLGGAFLLGWVGLGFVGMLLRSEALSWAPWVVLELSPE